MASQIVQTGRRAAPRLRLSLPGRFIALYGHLPCIITNLSQTGAMIAVNDPLKVGDGGYLRCDPIDHFVMVVRSGDGRNAIEFDTPLEPELVLEVRSLQETLAEREKEDLLQKVHSWTRGEGSGRW